jgi:lysophospholipase L1-like esterase
MGPSISIVPTTQAVLSNDGADNDTQNVVTYTVNPVTGGISLSAGGSQVLNLNQKNGLYQNMNTQAWQTTFGGYCWRLAMEIPSHARAFRVLVPKAQQGTWTVDGIAVCATDTAASPARFDPGTGAAWVVGTFDGVLTGKTIPAFVPPDQYQVNALGDGIWSDWIYCKTIPRVDIVGANPIVVVSIFSSSVNTMCVNGGTGSDNGFDTEPMRRWDTFKSAAANATGSFSSGSANPQALPIWAVQWVPTVAAISVGCFGDSIMQGQKTTPLSRGYVIKTAALLTANSTYKVSSFNSGIGGDRVISSVNRFRLLVASKGGLPNIAMYPLYTRNSNSTMSIEQMEGCAEVFVKTALANGVLPALVSGIVETALPANNATCTAANALALAMSKAYNIPFIDQASVITLANAATYLDVDGIHPNNTGDDLLAVNAATTLLPWITTAGSIGKSF